MLAFTSLERWVAQGACRQDLWDVLPLRKYPGRLTTAARPKDRRFQESLHPETGGSNAPKGDLRAMPVELRGSIYSANPRSYGNVCCGKEATCCYRDALAWPNRNGYMSQNTL